jgi:hypothetical protein
MLATGGEAMSKELLSQLSEPFPQSALKQRQGGQGRAFTYVEGHTVIHRLNACLPDGWSFTVKSTDLKPWGTTQRGAAQWLVLATVELTIPGLGTRGHVGVQVVSEGAGEDLFKGAVTDGLKKAATLFGVALELYGHDYEAGEVAAPAQRQTQPPPQRQQQAQPASTVQQAPAPASERVAGGATKKQIGKLRVQASQAGHNDDNLHGQLWARYRLEHLDQLDSKRASDLIDRYIKLDFIDVPADNPRQVQRHDPVQARASGMDVPEEPAYLREAPGQDSWTR